MKSIFKLLPIVAILLAALICLSSCGTSGTPKANDASGTIEGTKIEWSFTSKNNTMKISGVGEIPSFKSESELPWADVIKSITTLNVEEGITAIGDRAFYGASALSDITFADSVISIGECTFAFSGLEKVDLSKTSIVKIGYAAFEGCTSLESVTTSSTLAELGGRAFAYCAELTSVRIPSVVKIESETFFNCTKLASFSRAPMLTAEAVAPDAFKGTTFTFEDTAEYSDQEVTVTVVYVIEDDIVTMTPEQKTETHKVGEAFSIISPTIEGYEASELAVKGTAKSDETKNVYTVTYKKIAEETTDAAQVVEPTTDPTREPNYTFLIIMVVVLAVVGVGAYFLMKSNKREEEKAKNQNKAKNRKQKDDKEK